MSRRCRAVAVVVVVTILGLAGACGAADPAIEVGAGEPAQPDVVDDGDAPAGEAVLESDENEAPIGVEWLRFDAPTAMTGYTAVSSDPIPERLAAFAEVAVRGQVVALGPADFMVPESTKREFDNSGARLAREIPAAIATPLVVRVHEVLGARSDHSFAVEVGQELQLWVGGGTVEFTVTPEDAERTGLRPDVGHEEEQVIIDSGTEPPNGPGPVPDSSFDAGYSTAEFVSLAEGQEVIAFLRWADWYDPVANDGSSFPEVRLLLAVDYSGAGLFVRDVGADRAFAHAASGAEIAEGELRLAAGAIDDLSGRAEQPRPLVPSIYGDD